MNLFRFLLRQKQQQEPFSSTQQHNQAPLTTNLYDNTAAIKELLDYPNDLIVRMLNIGDSQHTCAVVCIDGLVDKDLIHGEVIKNIQLGVTEADKPIPASGPAVLTLLEAQVISISGLARVSTMEDVMLAVLSGDTALFVNGADQVLIISSRGWASRGVEEPQTEALIRGPRDGFTENLRTNTVHIRRRIRDPNLRFHATLIGRRAKKEVLIAYIEGICHPQLIQEVKRRIQTMDIDDPEGSGYIEQWISDSFLSPFPLILSTERPDKVSAALLQGKVAVLVDGTPFVLILPVTIANAFQSPEDYYSNWLIATLFRFMRAASAFLATFLPGLYIALVEYHHGMIPSKLAFSIAGTREGVPFPAVIEALMMEVTLEILREAGIRLPKPIGQTIGIVGGLVIGEAAVQAGIVSPIMVIVVSITAITSFALPSYAFGLALRMVRFAIMISAAFFGLYGVILAYIMINIHIVNLKSFGIPYSTPFAPTFINDWKDLFLRVPVTMMNKRPQMTQTVDKTRIDKSPETYSDPRSEEQ